MSRPTCRASPICRPALLDVKKIEHLIGLDCCYGILSWGSITELEALRRSLQMQAMCVLLPIGVKDAAPDD